MAESTRVGDIVGRLGGEEFAVLLMNANRTTAKSVSSRICQRIKIDTTGDLVGDAPSFSLTMSLGGVKARPGQNLTELIRHAGHALYNAKSRGRARAVFYERESTDRSFAGYAGTCPMNGE